MGEVQMSLANMFSYQVSNAGDALWPLLRSYAFVALKPGKYGAAAATRPQPCAKVAKGVSGLVRPCLN